MNNFWFYWSMWGFFLIVAFFFRKGSQKTGLMAILLITIAVSTVNVPIGSVKLNLSYIVLALTGFSFLSGESFTRILQMAMASSILMLGDLLAQIYWLYDPAILMVLPEWTFILFMGLFSITLSGDFWKRIALILIGMSQAEVLQSLVFYPYDNQIGDTDYLVIVGFMLGVVVCFELLSQATQTLRMMTAPSSSKRFTK